MSLNLKEIIVKRDYRGKPIRLVNSFLSYGMRSQIDENDVDEYTEKLINEQNDQLDPLKHDLAVWINKTTGINYITRDNFLHSLDNGAILCHLAQIIKQRAKFAIQYGLTKKHQVPKISSKYFANAMRKSFFSRDNVENFILFCRSIGVHQNVLFESDDLVLHKNPRSVILCLLEVARIGTHFGIEPPNLIQLEKEMVHAEKHMDDSKICWQFRSDQAQECDDICWNKHLTHSFVKDEISFSSLPPLISPQMVLDQYPSLPTREASYTSFETKLINETNTYNGLDQKIEERAKIVHSNCKCTNQQCVKLNIRKIGEGKYTIAGRNVLVRLLKNQDIMVRVGGGWDTLDHFLQRHDPCQVNGKLLPTTRGPTNYKKKYTYYRSFNKVLRPGESAI